MNQRGFTLVELSIVLVILGLLIGGVLTGQSLIRAAELRSVATQQARFVTAVQTFRDKYFALPGDMTNAQSYWGVANATASTCVTTSSSDSKTCNGDGNGLIDVSAGSNEYFRFWQHLANAGLIEGSYIGISPTFTQTTTSANSPSGRISGSLWYAANLGTITAGGYYFNGVLGNSLTFGKILDNGWPANPLFKPEDAYNIDTKIDDGKPATGKVVITFFPSGDGYSGNATSCTDASSSSTLTANYRLSNSTISCSLVFAQAF